MSVDKLNAGKSVATLLLLLIPTLTVMATPLNTLAGTALLQKSSPHNLVAEYIFNGTAIAVKGYSVGMPTPIYIRLPVVSGTIKTHFLSPFIKYKVIIVCGKSVSKPMVRRSYALIRTRCYVRLPLVFSFNASVKVFRYGNNLFKVYLALNMTYPRFIVKPLNQTIGIVNGDIYKLAPTPSKAEFELIFPPGSSSPLRLKFPRMILSGFRLLYVFTEHPSTHGALVRVNGTYAGNMLPFYVLWPSTVKEYLTYKHKHIALFFENIGFKIRLINGGLNAYIPYGIGQLYSEVLHPTEPIEHGIANGTYISMTIPSVSGVPITRMIASANTTSLGFKVLRIIRSALTGGRYSYTNISLIYAILPVPEVSIDLPLTSVPGYQGLGFIYVSHYPVAIYSIPVTLPAGSKVATALKGADALVLFGAAYNYYVIPSNKYVMNLYIKPINMPKSGSSVPTGLFIAIAAGIIGGSSAVIYYRKKSKR